MSVFEYLEFQAREENLPFKNAASIAIDRAERRFSSFMESAKGEKEFNSRLALVADEIMKIANATCEEYGYDDPQHVAKLVIGQLQLLAEAKPEAGGEADERQKLPTMPADGYYTEPTVALNPNSAGDHMKNTNPDIPELKADDSQDPTDASWPHDEAIPMEGDGLERTKVTDQKPEQVGPSTQTFPNKGQADPVTAAYMGDVWTMEDGEDPENDFPEDPRERMSLSDMISPGEMEEDDSEERLQEDMDAPYSDMSPMGFDHKMKRHNDNDAYDAAGLHSERDRKSPSYFDDRKNWKQYRDNQYHPVNAKTAAERMDFNQISEMMTPSQAISNLVDAGMPEHEAKDRIDFYVNHVNPGWAQQTWTSSSKQRMYERALDDEQSLLESLLSEDLSDLEEERTQWHDDDEMPSVGSLYSEEEGDEFLNPTLAASRESMWDSSDPELVEMSHDVYANSPDEIRMVYDRYMGSGRFETPQEAVDTIFLMMTENRPEQIDQIAAMFQEAGLNPSNVEDVRQYAGRFANTKTSDHPGVVRDQIKYLQNALKNMPMKKWERDKIEEQLNSLMASEEELSQEYYTPGTKIDPEEEDRIRAEMPDVVGDTDEEDMTTPSVKTSPTKNMPVKYKMLASNVYQSFLKKANKK